MKEKFCPECGPAEVPHFLARTNIALDFIALAFTKPLSPLVRFIFRKFSYPIEILEYFSLEILSFLGVIRLAKYPSDEKDTDRAKCMWKAGKERGIKIRQVWTLGKPINIFLARLPNGKKIIFEGLPRPGLDSESLEWMDNKGIVKKKFRKAGFPVPRGRGCFTKSCALRIFKEIRKNGGMVVTKPTLGSRSRHTRVHVKTEIELLEAFKIAKQICPIVSVEEELRGTVFRVVLIGGQIVGVLRRDPPFVIGDGKMNIRDLVNQANQNPKRHGPIFHEIPFNSEMDEALRLQTMNRESVPDFGKKIIVGTKVGRSQGGTNVDVTDEMHIENRKLFWDVAKFLQDPLVGIDFIIEDIRKPWRSQMPCGIIELNSVPFLDLHMYPFEGKVRDLSAVLWDEVLK